jgi:hypothetical protein
MLAKAEMARTSPGERQKSVERAEEPARQIRSRSVSSVDSVSTFSTNRSRSRSQSPFRRRVSREEAAERRPRRFSSRSMSKARGRKRQRRSVSSSSESRSRPRQPGSHRKNRRYRTLTPEDRGRPDSERKGSHRDSGSPSVDKSRVTKDRRSFDQGVPQHTSNGHDRLRNDEKRRERSPSPYSKRIALTQAMNS